MAMARYFTLFRERKQLLTRVYGAVKDRDLLTLQSAPTRRGRLLKTSPATLPPPSTLAPS
jgi:hypothetical protein